MYGARAYLAYIGYGVILLFQDEILRDNGNFWSPKINYRSCIAINIGPSLSYHVIVSHQKWKFLSRTKRKPPSKLEDLKNLNLISEMGKGKGVFEPGLSIINELIA